MSNLDKLHDELENLKMVQYRMVADGFHYCFKHYSSFTEIEDEKFHELRKQYLESAKQLKDYIDLKVEEIQDNIDNIENI
jgi:hypothetical protein